MDTNIAPIPPVPKEIVEAISNNSLAVFIGAGVSRIIGCISWNELAQGLVNECFRRKKKDGTRCINFKEKETILSYSDNKKIITICHHILKNEGLEEVFYDQLKRSLNVNGATTSKHNIYDDLYLFRGLFITTNADRLFDAKFNPSQIVYKIDDFVPELIDRNKLYHIHGSIGEPESLVFTVPQYIRRYNEPNFREFLEEIFRKFTVLFVGYGMSEFELLDFLIMKMGANQDIRHFTLLPFYNGETNILKFEKSYYASMGIKVLPYLKDERGYEQLSEVVKAWSKEINQASSYLYDSYQEIENIVNNFKHENIDKLLQIIKNDEPQRAYLFKYLSISSNPSPWLKVLYENGYFNPENNPVPEEDTEGKGFFFIPSWDVLGFLENVARQNENNPEPNTINLLRQIVTNIINFKDQAGKRVDNYKTDETLIEVIFRLPIEHIKMEDIYFIDISLQTEWRSSPVAHKVLDIVFPKLIKSESQKLLVTLVEIILKYKKGNSEYTSIMESYYLVKVLKKFEVDLFRICGIEIVKIALDKMTCIIEEDFSRFNTILIPAIENHSQTIFPDKYECQLVYFVRNFLEWSSPLEIKDTIKNLLNLEHPIFKRITIHIINYHYQELKCLFWNWRENPLEEERAKHELYELLKNNARTFTEAEITKVLRWIETKHYYISNEVKGDKKRVRKILAYQKREWLSALLKNKDTRIKELYDKYSEINDIELKHPGFDYWSEQWVDPISPIDKNELLNKSIDEIVEYIIDFKEERGWKKPSREGLAISFQAAISNSPEKFAGEVKAFLKVPRDFQYYLIMGFNQAWRVNKVFDWGDLLSFILNLIIEEDFWDEQDVQNNYNYRNWILMGICNLLEDGLRSDAHAFSENYMHLAEQVLLELSNRVTIIKEEEPEIERDLALNSIKGSLFSAMVLYSLRYARLYRIDSSTGKWVEKIKMDFTQRIDHKKETSVDFFFILGRYIPDLFHLDKNWVTDNLNNIFNKKDHTYWVAAFSGYLYYASKIYSKIYFLLKENKHYIKALNTEFQNEHLTERISQHICVAYLEGWENLEDTDSLVYTILKDGNHIQLSAIVHFFWVRNEELPSGKVKEKINPLWQVLYERLIDTQGNSDYDKILSDLTRWLPLLDKIDERSEEWLKLSAKYVGQNFNESFFIEELLKHVQSTPDRVGRIFLEMLNSGTYPDYDKIHIQGIIQILYKNQQKELADRICNLYGAKGFSFLRETYASFNKAHVN